MPPELKAVLDLTGCAAVIVAIILFLRHLRFEREDRSKERKEFLDTIAAIKADCASERKEYHAMIERIEGKFADVVDDFLRTK